MAMSSLIGQKVGKYEIVERLGVGGMATVYKGKDTVLGRFVAIKILSEAVSANDDASKRFLQEARTAASLDNTDYIVRIFDYATQQDITYIAMQLLEGGTLDQRFQNVQKGVSTPASLGEISDLLLKLAGALHTAHNCGIIHRDIKPSNVMFDMKGKPYLTDFGIVKLMDTTTGAGLTGSNMTMGTPSYMSPEQWRAENITPASDQYALGVMIYQLIASKLPFEAPSQVSLFNKHLYEPLPAISNRPEFPQSAMDVLQKATAKTTSERYADVSEFARAFNEAIHAANVVGQPTGTFTRPVLRSIPGSTPPSGSLSPKGTAGPAASVIVTGMTTAQMIRTPLFLGMGGLMVLLIAIIAIIGASILLRPSAAVTAAAVAIVNTPSTTPTATTSSQLIVVETSMTPSKPVPVAVNPTVPTATPLPPTDTLAPLDTDTPIVTLSPTHSTLPTMAPTDLPSTAVPPTITPSPTAFIIVVTATPLPTSTPLLTSTLTPTVTPAPVILSVTTHVPPTNTPMPTPTTTPVPPTKVPPTVTPAPTLTFTQPLTFTPTARPAFVSATGGCVQGDATFTVTNSGGQPLVGSYTLADFNGLRKQGNVSLAPGDSFAIDFAPMVGDVRLTVIDAAAQPTAFVVACAPPTATFTLTPPPTDLPRPTNTLTFTLVPPTDTPVPTATPIPPTRTLTPSNTPAPTATPIPPTRTPRPSPTLLPTATNTPDRLKPTGMQDVFTDRFTDNQQGWGLFQSNGVSATIDRGLTLTVGAGKALEVPIPLDKAGDFYLDATVSYSLPADAGPANIFGVYFRSASSSRGYLLEFEPSSCYIFYAFLDFSFVSKQPLTTCAIKTSKQFDLKLIATGNQVVVYVNGSRVGTLTDPDGTFTSGTIGLYAQADAKNGGDFSVTFTNLSVATS